MHGNGCQQAFSFCSTIRTLSLVDGWLASNRAELQCCQVSHITYEVGSTYPFPKYQGGHFHPTVNAQCIFKIRNGNEWMSTTKPVWTQRHQPFCSKPRLNTGDGLWPKASDWAHQNPNKQHSILINKLCAEAWILCFWATPESSLTSTNHMSVGITETEDYKLIQRPQKTHKNAETESARWKPKVNSNILLPMSNVDNEITP